MNRLIIIGNGFDLAHGMPTQYSDFMKWYLISIFKTLRRDIYEDEALIAEPNKYIYDNLTSTLSSIVDGSIDPVYLASLLNNNSSATIFNSELPFFFNFKLPFVQNIMVLYSELKWVDIENEYYKQLLEISKLESQLNKNERVDALNKGLDHIKLKLEEYLSSVRTPDSNEVILDIMRSVSTNNLLRHKSFITNSPSDILLLSFNYTKTTDLYLSALKAVAITGVNDIDQIRIHGEIMNAENPIIFGFGDEMDENYKILERTNYNGFLNNMKSFGYFKTDNYHNLIRFISTTLFEVYLMGHSCGLSDRVMLNMIFEHENCSMIKIFFHETSNGNNFKTLTQDISRHFNKKGLMREKIVPFNKSVPLPQSK